MVNFVLRQWELDDAAMLVAHLNNKNVTAYFRDSFPQPYTFSDARAYITTNQYTEEQQRRYCRCIAINDQVIGSVDITVQEDVERKSAELGYFLAQQWWGQNIMPAVIQQACQYSFAHYDIVRIFATVFALNQRSARVLEKAGFTKEATLRQSIYKHGVFMDAYIYAILKSEFTPIS